MIGGALAAMANGRGTRPVASVLGLPHETARGWRRRYRARAPTLAAGFAALAVGLGTMATDLARGPERAGLEALAMAWSQARRRLGESVVEVFEFASLVTGGELLGTTASPPWAGLGGAALMPRPRQPVVEEQHMSLDSAEAVALRRYALIAEAANPRLTPRERGG